MKQNLIFCLNKLFKNMACIIMMWLLLCRCGPICFVSNKHSVQQNWSIFWFGCLWQRKKVGLGIWSNVLILMIGFVMECKMEVLCCRGLCLQQMIGFVLSKVWKAFLMDVFTMMEANSTKLKQINITTHEVEVSNL